MTSSKKAPPMRPAPSPQGPSAPKAASSAYSRFIPREELSGFSAWSPGAIDGGDEHAAQGVHRAEAAAPPAAPMPSPAEVLAEQLRQVRSTAYQDGYRDGLVALEGFKQSYASQITAQLGSLTQAYMQQLDALQQDMARALAVSATHLARQMVRTELSVHPELVATVAQEAVDTLLLSAHHITLRVHPDDLALVSQGAADVLAARGARLLSDASVARGGCVVESDIGVVDASLETRWRRAAALLGCDERWTEAPHAAHPPAQPAYPSHPGDAQSKESAP
jgi:flagellar assembly protein FliH